MFISQGLRHFIKLRIWLMYSFLSNNDLIFKQMFPQGTGSSTGLHIVKDSALSYNSLVISIDRLIVFFKHYFLIIQSNCS